MSALIRDLSLTANKTSLCRALKMDGSTFGTLEPLQSRSSPKISRDSNGCPWPQSTYTGKTAQVKLVSPSSSSPLTKTTLLSMLLLMKVTFCISIGQSSPWVKKLKLLRISEELGTQNATTDPAWPLKDLPSTMTWSWLSMISTSQSGRLPSTHKNCLSIAVQTPSAATTLVELSHRQDLVSFLSRRLMVLMCGIS